MEITTEEVIKKLEELEGEYAALSETPIPRTVKEAKEQRWQLISGAVELALLTYYPKEKQEDDSRRAMPLSVALRMISDLEEKMIREIVIKPQDIAENALFSATLGLGKTIWDIVKDVWKTLSAFFRTPDKQIVLKVLSTIVLSKFVRSINLIAIPEYAKSILRGLKMRNETEARMKGVFLPQRSGPRFRRRKESRR